MYDPYCFQVGWNEYLLGKSYLNLMLRRKKTEETIGGVVQKNIAGSTFFILFAQRLELTAICFYSIIIFST